jgi:c-di-GMP-binding flagellar brake protein YcgR
MKITTQKQEIQSRHGTVNFESRRHPRFNVDLPIEYYRIDSSITHTGRAHNISEGGLLLYFSEEMDVSQYLNLKLFFSSGSESNIIEVIAEVVWMDMHLGEQGDYRCGVNIIDIAPEDRIKLRNFIRSLSSP